MIRFLRSFILYPLTGGIDWKARLAADVERRKNSFEIEQYRRRRAAALRGLGRATT